MKFIDSIKAAIVRRLTPQEPDAWYGADMLSTSGQPVSESSALAVSSTWACVNLWCGTISTLPLMVYQTKGESREPARNHPLFRLLHDSPNYEQTTVDFWEYMQAGLELWGNAYAEKIYSNGVVTSLLPITPQAMNVRRTQSGMLEYNWTSNGRNYIRSSKDVLHIRGFGGDPMGGMSTLQFGRNSFGLSQAIETSAASTFKNGLRASGALTFSEFLTPEQRAIAKSELVREYVGATNSGKPFILEGGVQWQPLTMNPEDAQMLESRKFSVEEICRWFGVPPHMIGHTEKNTSWGSGIEQQTLGFQKFNLNRRLNRIEAALSKQLLTAADRAKGIIIEFNLEGLLRGDSVGRSKFYQTMVMIGAMTVNEVRRLENMPPVEGGDLARTQMQNVPLNEVQNDNGK